MAYTRLARVAAIPILAPVSDSNINDLLAIGSEGECDTGG